MTTSELDRQVRDVALAAKAASRALRSTPTARKDAALAAIARGLRARADAIVAENAHDLAAANESGTPAPMVDRLTLTRPRIEALARSVEAIAALPDPVGAIDGLVRRPSGITVGRMRVPLGVIAMIYEARPNVTVDAAALCLKSGNAVVLRGGKEARRSNQALADVVRDGLREAGVPQDAVVTMPSYEREATRALLGLVGVVDVAIPRGGPGLIAFVAEHARVPVIAHYLGVCHLFVDADADVAQAIALTVDGKARRPGVCNALECLLVHRDVAQALLPALDDVLAREGVEVRADARAREWMERARPAADDDFGREFLAKTLAVKVVDDLDGALEHVGRYGSGHTEAICTPSYEHAQRWLRDVDASCVVVNASTRFNDGGELGLGAELGTATSKLHAYGPMGLEELTTRKWIVYGNGEVRG
ncbi:MAG: glutamate-5-semialdehyde dehydrogenase [Polyangiales bacterium]